MQKGARRALFSSVNNPLESGVDLVQGAAMDG